MKMNEFQKILEFLEETDSFIAECLTGSIDTIEETLNRELSNDEKMIAYTMFKIGMALDRVMEDPTSNLPSLN